MNPMKKSVRKAEKGVTLPEVMIALVVLMFITMSVSGMFFNAAQMEKKDAAITEAGHVAITRMEATKQRITSTDDFNNLVTTTYFDLPDNVSFVYDVDVNTISTSVKQVSIRVYYRDPGTTAPAPDVSKPNLGRIVQLGTYITRP